MQCMGDGGQPYCRIQINSSVMHHRGYLTCRNMIAVTCHKGVLTKGLNHDNNQIWQFWLKIWLSAKFSLQRWYAAIHLRPIITKMYCSTATTDEILTMSWLPKQGDENKISSGVSWSQKGVNLN